MLNLLIAASIDIANSNARHGVGLFETIRIRNGAPLRLDAHIKRLAAGTSFFGMEPPPPFEEVLEFLITKTICASLNSGVIRLLAVDGDLHTTVCDWKPSHPKSINVGISIDITRFSRDILKRFKTISYADNRLMMAEAGKRGLYEVIALNESGHLTDGSRTNIFLVIEGLLVTPPVTSGALPGIIRGILLQAKLAREAIVTVDDLEKVEAVVLSNSLQEVIVVDNIERHKEDKLNIAHPLIVDAINLIS